MNIFPDIPDNEIPQYHINLVEGPKYWEVWIDSDTSAGLLCIGKGTTRDQAKANAFDELEILMGDLQDNHEEET